MGAVALLGLTVNPDIPLFAMSARLVEQKGLDIVLGAEMIPRLEAQWAFLGEGEARYQDAIAGAVSIAWAIWRGRSRARSAARWSALRVSRSS